MYNFMYNRCIIVTLLANSKSLTSARSSLVKTKPTFPLMCGRSLSNHTKIIRYPDIKSHLSHDRCGNCLKPCVPGCPLRETNRDSWKQVSFCRGNDNTALRKLHCNLSCYGNISMHKPTHFSRAGLFSRCPRMALRIMVFLPIRTTAFSRRESRMVCICLEPTLSAPTMKHLG